MKTKIPDFAFNGDTLRWLAEHGAKLDRAGVPLFQVVLIGKSHQVVQDREGRGLQHVIEEAEKQK